MAAANTATYADGAADGSTGEAFDRRRGHDRSGQVRANSPSWLVVARRASSSIALLARGCSASFVEHTSLSYRSWPRACVPWSRAIILL